MLNYIPAEALRIPLKNEYSTLFHPVVCTVQYKVHCAIRNYKQQINKYLIKLINSGMNFNFPADNTVNVTAD